MRRRKVLKKLPTRLKFIWSISAPSSLTRPTGKRYKLFYISPKICCSFENLSAEWIAGKINELMTKFWKKAASNLGPDFANFVHLSRWSLYLNAMSPRRWGTSVYVSNNRSGLKVQCNRTARMTKFTANDFTSKRDWRESGRVERTGREREGSSRRNIFQGAGI